MLDLDTLTPDQREAVEECFHQSDLIGRLPLPCEIEWAIQSCWLTRPEDRGMQHA